MIKNFANLVSQFAGMGLLFGPQQILSHICFYFCCINERPTQQVLMLVAVFVSVIPNGGLCLMTKMTIMNPLLSLHHLKLFTGP
jgi:hypothetical protein